MLKIGQLGKVVDHIALLDIECAYNTPVHTLFITLTPYAICNSVIVSNSLLTLSLFDCNRLGL